MAENKKTPEAKEKRRLWNRDREKSDKAKERGKKHSMIYRTLYPEKEAAQQAVWNARRRGDIVKPEACQRCGAIPEKTKSGRSRIHAHHSDYSKPLEIEWLCLDCHCAEHNRALERGEAKS
jgi:hypothetical protein